MLINDFALLSLPIFCASLLLCQRLSKQQPKLMRSHLIKLGIHKFTWVLYWIGLMGVFALQTETSLNTVHLLIMTVSGLALMSLRGMLLGFQLQRQGRLVTHQDKTLLLLNGVLLLAIVILFILNI